MEKNFKLIVVVILLVIANLYVFSSVIVTTQYTSLSLSYNRLYKEHKELEKKYNNQIEVMAQIKEELKNSTDKSDIKTFKNNIKEEGLNAIFNKFGLDGIKDFIESFQNRS